jgi:hypothetical protein
VPDLYTYDIAEAFRRHGCPLCRALEEDEARSMASFLREGRRAREARRRFYAGGGFCRRHAWLFHRLATEENRGAPIADIYGRLVERDLELLGRLRNELGGRRKRLSIHLTREADCPACEWAEATLERKATFFLKALAEAGGRSRYERSDGLCFSHFAAVFAEALATEREAALFLLDDWQARLQQLRHELEEYDRRRDHRYAHEPKGREQESWTEVIRRYAGGTPAAVP